MRTYSIGVKMATKSARAETPIEVDQDNGIVAVIDSPNSKTLVVWWVSLDQTFEGDGSNLCGAWTISVDATDDIESVVYRVLWLPTPSGAKALSRLGITSRPVVDSNAVLSEVVAWGDEVEAAFKAEKLSSSTKKNLKDFVIPKFPDSLDLKNPPIASGCPDEVAVALGVARWFGKVSSSWHLLETRRLARKSMRELFGTERRPLPIVFD